MTSRCAAWTAGGERVLRVFLLLVIYFVTFSHAILTSVLFRLCLFVLSSSRVAVFSYIDIDLKFYFKKQKNTETVTQYYTN